VFFVVKNILGLGLSRGRGEQADVHDTARVHGHAAGDAIVTVAVARDGVVFADEHRVEEFELQLGTAAAFRDTRRPVEVR
jgi:hypothetical protein